MLYNIILQSNNTDLQAILNTINGLPKVTTGSNSEDSLITRAASSYTNSRVTNIGQGVFAYADKLESADFPEVTSIGSSAFYSCSNLTTISFPLATTIETQAFQSCAKLSSVNFPKVTSIGSSAFYSCSNLTTISFPLATTIETKAFYKCYKLSSVNFPEVTSIGSRAFSSCFSLTTISFPLATTIETQAFQSCAKLSSVNFPKVTSIGYWAFQDCFSLTTISFPLATTIGTQAFYGCYKLSSVSFPEVISILNNAFQNCSNLTTMSFPSVTTIETQAFSGCYNLRSLYLTGSYVATLSNSNAFNSTPYAGYSASFSGMPYIYVPQSLLTSYQTATNWTYFSSYFSAIASGLEFEEDEDVEDQVDKITFTIEANTILELQAEEGMTWGEWIDSDYNTVGAINDSGSIRLTGVSESPVLYDEGFMYKLSINDVITAGAYYIAD